MTFSPSGQQFELSVDDQHVTIVEVGGGIRSYRFGDRDGLQPYAMDQMCDGAHGAPLIPWPNRLGDGRYRVNGTDYQVSLTEPDKHNAIHGFLRWRPWQPIEREADRIVMAATLFPLPGYPFALDVRIDYRLTDDGLTVTTTATNIGDHPCPYGCGQHPYRSPGAGLIDDCTLHLAADTLIVTDPNREVPVETEPVGDTPLRLPRRQDTQRPEGRLRVHLPDPRRRGPSVGAADRQRRLRRRALGRPGLPNHRNFPADTLAPDRRRKGLAPNQ
jgi:aldose 1-epimerase